MLVNVCFDICADVIDCEDNIAENIIKYKEEFDEWFYDLVNHTNKEAWDGAKTFVKWLNNAHPEANSKVVQVSVQFEDLDRTIPTIFF